MAMVTAMAAGIVIADITMAGTGDAATGVIITTSLQAHVAAFGPRPIASKRSGFGVAPLLMSRHPGGDEARKRRRIQTGPRTVTSPRR